MIYRFFLDLKKLCRCVKIRRTCCSPALCSSLVCSAMCEVSAGTSSRASFGVHLVISYFWKIANNLIFSLSKEKNLGPVRSRRTNSASVHDETKWAVTSETLREILEERSIHHFFHFATVCTAQSVYLAGTRDSLHCHTSRQAHNKSSAKNGAGVRRSIPPSGIIERWCSPDDRGAIFLRLWHQSCTKYLYESDFHPSAALTWYGSLQSNKTLHSWPKRIGKSRTA